jgi:RHS repeat-associated protein
LTNVTSAARAFGYQYDSARGVSVTAIRLPNGAYITNYFDSVGRLNATGLGNSANTLLNWHNYTYNLGGQREFQSRLGASYLEYTYDHIGQLKTANGYEPDDSPRLHEQLGYAYDAAGNLTHRTNNALVQTFGVNSLNQLTAVTRSGTLTVSGTTSGAATNVTVNNLTATLYSDNTFAKDALPLVNGTTNFTASARDGYGRADTNTVTVNLTNSVVFVYDLNGNLRTNGTRTYEYDDENQLNRITQPGVWKSEFTYDGLFRRRIEKNYTWTGSSWLLTNETRFVYDGLLPIQHRDANNLPTLTLTRGKDLSGGMQGAGGIGGLLAMTEGSGATSFYHADGSGNVTALINTNQLIVARYLYDPFGTTLSLSGPKAQINPYRFSSKPVHEVSGMYDYLYRWYVPELQRWLNPDPLEEWGGINLYEAFFNNPEGFVDRDGADNWSNVTSGQNAVNRVLAPWVLRHYTALPPLGVSGPTAPDYAYQQTMLVGAPHLVGTPQGRTQSELTAAVIGALLPLPLGKVPCAAKAATPSGQFYSVAFETRLSPSSYPGVLRPAHFQEANEALLRAMEADAQFAQIMQQGGVNLQRTATGLAPRTSPAGWTWHHAPEPGVMQLVPRSQHAPGSIFQDVLHPGGQGGYSIWGQ